MKANTFASRFIILMLLILTVEFGYSQTQPSKDITVYQYRKVAPDKVDEFIKRETTYWSEVAKKSMEKGNLQFWALLEKAGGNADEPNFLFINTYRNIDDAGAVWGSAASLFPKVPMAQMETNSMSKTTATFFLSNQGWEQKDKSPMADQKYVVMVFHKSNNAGRLIELEKKHWAPFIKASMNNGQTSQVAWGNAVVLDPISSDLKFNSVSYDLYSSLREAIYPTWDPKVVFPQEGLTEIEKLEGPFGRYSEVYRVVKVIVPPVNATAGN
jgi:hypothetical protein